MNKPIEKMVLHGLRSYHIQKGTTEDQARKITKCLGCGCDKGLSAVVCWKCFKHRDDMPVLKYFDGTFQDWLIALNAID
jgi:hypothetical protein